MKGKLIIVAGVLLLLIVPGGLAIQSNRDLLPLAQPVFAQPDHSESSSDLFDFEKVFVQAAEKIKPSVVSVISTRKVEGLNFRRFERSPFDDFFGGEFHQFFDNLPRSRDFTQRGLGSGVIVDAKGYILTNNHVIDQADSLVVKLHDGRECKAEVVGTDPKSDLAVVKIEAKNLVPAELGQSAKVRVGQWVMAVGNPFGLSQTMTSGIVSAVGREGVGVAQYEDFIQTDAAINQGNSGGPLIDLRGRVIGINTAIMSRGGGNDGVGMAIPIDMANHVMAELIDKGTVTRGWLGVGIQDLTEGLAESFDFDKSEGVLVANVQSNGPADKAGLRSGDIIVSLDGQTMKDASALRHRVAQMVPDTKVKLKVWRAGKTRTLTVTLGTMPEDPALAGGSPQATEDQLGMELADARDQVLHHFNLPADASGAVITRVEPGSPAESAGLRPGDVITHVHNKTVASAADAARLLGQHDLSKGVRLRVQSGEGQRFVFMQVRD